MHSAVLLSVFHYKKILFAIQFRCKNLCSKNHKHSFSYVASHQTHLCTQNSEMRQNDVLRKRTCDGFFSLLLLPFHSQRRSYEFVIFHRNLYMFDNDATRISNYFIHIMHRNTSRNCSRAAFIYFSALCSILLAQIGNDTSNNSIHDLDTGRRVQRDQQTDAGSNVVHG